MEHFCILTLLLLTSAVILTNNVGDALIICCLGYIHDETCYPTFLCHNGKFCCVDTEKYVQNVSTIQVCCNEEEKRIPSSVTTGECSRRWIADHSWVPTLTVCLFVGLVIAISCGVYRFCKKSELLD